MRQWGTRPRRAEVRHEGSALRVSQDLSLYRFILILVELRRTVLEVKKMTFLNVTLTCCRGSSEIMVRSHYRLKFRKRVKTFYLRTLPSKISALLRCLYQSFFSISVTIRKHQRSVNEIPLWYHYDQKGQRNQ